MAYRKSEITKEKIMKAAIYLFSKKGYAATTTREISKEANVANGTLFKYFHSKDELLKTIFLKGTEQFLDSMLFESIRDLLVQYKDRPVEDLLKALIKDRIMLVEKNRCLMRVVFREIQLHEEIRKIFVDKVADRMLGIVKQMILQRNELGEVRDTDAFLIVRSVVGMIGAMFVQKMLFAEEFKDMDLDYEVDKMVDLILYGIKNK